MKKYAVLLTVLCAVILSVAMPYPKKEEKKQPVEKEQKGKTSTEVSLKNDEKKNAIDAKAVLAQAHLQIDSLNKQIHMDSIRLESKKSELKCSEDSLTVLSNRISKQDEALVLAASDFLFFPYNPELISKVAIPTFDAATTPDIIQKYSICRTLLVNQSVYINQLYAFFAKADKELAGMHSLGWDSEALKREFHNLQVYKDYTQYKNWEYTYMGIFLKEVDNEIPKINSKRKNVFPALIKKMDSLNFKHTTTNKT